MKVFSLTLKLNNFTLMCAIFLVVFIDITAQQSAANAQALQDNLVVHNPPDEGGPRRFEIVDSSELSIYDAASIDSPQVSFALQGEILSNLGCQLMDDHVWCKVQRLRGKKRGFVLAEYLVPATGPDGVIAMGIDDSSRRARKGQFDSRGRIQCAQVQGQAMGECTIAITRGDGGDATAIVTFSNDFKRTLYFAHGTFISANATMSGVGTDTDWHMRDGHHFIRVDDQQYEIPDNLLVNRRSASE